MVDRRLRNELCGGTSEISTGANARRLRHALAATTALGAALLCAPPFPDAAQAQTVGNDGAVGASYVEPGVPSSNEDPVAGSNGGPGGAGTDGSGSSAAIFGSPGSEAAIGGRGGNGAAAAPAST